MKGKMKSILTALFAAVLVIGSVGTGKITASAQEAKAEVDYEETSAYMIYHAVTDTSYSYTQPNYWVSPYAPYFSIKGEEPRYKLPKMFNMVNKSLIDANKTEADGPYASFPVYCIDVTTETKKGTSYRRLNLEDSTYFTDERAGKIRAVLMESFPYIGTDAEAMQRLTAKVNEWAGETVVVDLTTAEALSGTQNAIWMLANDGEAEIFDYCKGAIAYSAGYREKVIDRETVSMDPVYDTEKVDDNTEDEVKPVTDKTIRNIESLSKYLVGLAAQPKLYPTLSEHSFKNVTTSYRKLSDGSYDVTVSYNIDAPIYKDDKLIISVASGDVVKAYELTEENKNGSITINVEELGDVTLEINGTRTTAGDVYLYEPVKGRKTAQCMVAYDTSSVSVHAEMTVTQRVLNFYKTTNTDQGRKPLEGVKFDIYLITEDIEAYNRGDIEIPSEVTEGWKETNGEYLATVTTDVQGKATCNLSMLAGQGVITGNGDGIYLVVEQSSAAVVAPIDPFFVCVPMTSVDGTGYVYNINVEPKNTVVPGPEIYKDVTSIENNSDTFDVNEEHTWIIRTTVPADIAEAKEYKITDVLDHRLTYQGDMAVKVGLKAEGAGEEQIALENGTDYIVLNGKTTTDGKIVDKFTVYLTENGRNKVAETVGAAYATYEIRVYFDAVINTNAAVGEAIPNRATLEYTNSYGYEYDVESDEPVVYTCGINLYKYDAKNESKPLEGAVFKLARVANDAEVASGLSSPLITTTGSVNIIFESFYASADFTSEKVSEVITNTSGAAAIYGLNAGTYYLVEVKAPKGYNLLSYPVAVTLNQESHLENRVIKVANSNAFILPETGGIGTTIFKIVGVTLIVAAVVVLIVKKKKEKDSDDDAE